MRARTGIAAPIWVSNPTYAAGNGQPQLIIANNVGLANATQGGIITASPAGSRAAYAAAANALRGIEFVGGGNAQLVNFGNVTVGALSNGGSLTDRGHRAAVADSSAFRSNLYTLFGYGRYKVTRHHPGLAAAELWLYHRQGHRPADPADRRLTIKSDNAYHAGLGARRDAGRRHHRPSPWARLHGNNYQQ